jgi:uncharacterized protein (TIGR00645 family)
VHWPGTIDVGSLKVRVASTIVAISSLHLPRLFLNSSSYTTAQLMWLTIIHRAFVVSALMPAYIDRLMGLSQGKKDEDVRPDVPCQRPQRRIFTAGPL